MEDSRSHWERWPIPWIGAGLGVMAGCLDALVAYSMDIEMTVNGGDVAPAVMVFFCVTYAGLGYVVGSLIRAQSRARRIEEVIAGQLRELETTQRALIQHEKLAAIGRLAAGIAHEVRNPLGVIRASAEMVQESFDPGDDPHRACQFICEEIDRLNSLIVALLSFAKPTEPKRESISLDRVVEQALDLASDTLKTRGVRADHRSASAACRLLADPNLVSQVVFDLLSNAAEALGTADPTKIGGSGLRIEIRTGIDESSAYVEVADNGPGIPEADAGQIFEPFFTTKDSGTGLGLPMALRITEAHGGTLCSLSGRGAGEHGRGACFRVDLPLESVATAQGSATP